MENQATQRRLVRRSRTNTTRHWQIAIVLVCSFGVCGCHGRGNKSDNANMTATRPSKAGDITYRLSDYAIVSVTLSGKTQSEKTVDHVVVQLGMSFDEVIDMLGMPDDIDDHSTDKPFFTVAYTLQGDWDTYSLHFNKKGLQRDRLSDIFVIGGY
jgi:hypothetical protein